MEIKPGKHYWHKKTGLMYRVEFLAECAERAIDLVIYRGSAGFGANWARTAEGFKTKFTDEMPDCGISIDQDGYLQGMNPQEMWEIAGLGSGIILGVFPYARKIEFQSFPDQRIHIMEWRPDTIMSRPSMAPRSSYVD